jgi:hypothetical protein
VAVDAGASHSLALTDGGDIYAWGANSYGQLGDNTTTQRTAAVQVSEPSAITFVAIAAGEDHSLGVASDGSIYAWGRNDWAPSLGDGTTTNRKTPVRVITETGAQSSGMTKVLAVGAGYYQSYAVRADGSLWAWGYNGYYQLGDGTNTSRKWAQPVPGLSGVVYATGDQHALAVTAAGELFAWGGNDYGQVGNGRTDQYQKTPVSISAADLDWRVAIPVMSPAGGPYGVEKSVAIATDTSGASIYYTTNGSDPTTSDTLVSGNVSVTQSLTLKARAFKSGMADSVVASEVYTLTAAAPTFSPVQGTYSNNQSVTLSSTSQGAPSGTRPTGRHRRCSTQHTGRFPSPRRRPSKRRRSDRMDFLLAATSVHDERHPVPHPTGGSRSAQNVTVTGTTTEPPHYTRRRCRRNPLPP